MEMGTLILGEIRAIYVLLSPNNLLCTAVHVPSVEFAILFRNKHQQDLGIWNSFDISPDDQVTKKIMVWASRFWHWPSSFNNCLWKCGEVRLSGTMTGANRYVVWNWTEEFNLIYYLKRAGSRPTSRSTYFSSQTRIIRSMELSCFNHRFFWETCKA
jgi:hypothetical protein